MKACRKTGSAGAPARNTVVDTTVRKRLFHVWLRPALHGLSPITSELLPDVAQRPRFCYASRMVWILAICAACACLWVEADLKPASPETPELVNTNTFTFTHMADASAGEWLGDGLLAVANDEDNLLRVYRLPQGGAPVASWDASPWMGLEKKSPEMDIEGSAKIGNTIYWITSHAPNKEGKPRPNRKRFFATRATLTNGVPSFQPFGVPVATLVADLALDPRYAAFGLAAASRRPPKTPGSLNIESLCDTPEGGLLIGFRSPNPQGTALLATLTNPADTVAGRPPAFGEPLQLDLGGNGVRAMIRTGDTYLIMSGSPLSGGTPQLYRWDGRAAPQREPLAGLPADATPECLVTVRLNGQTALLVLSDDGMRRVGGQPAKTLADPARRSFRACALGVPAGTVRPSVP
jgi:hypothetical protein